MESKSEKSQPTTKVLKIKENYVPPDKVQRYIPPHRKIILEAQKSKTTNKNNDVKFTKTSEDTKIVDNSEEKLEKQKQMIRQKALEDLRKRRLEEEAKMGKSTPSYSEEAKVEISVNSFIFVITQHDILYMNLHVLTYFSHLGSRR